MASIDLSTLERHMELFGLMLGERAGMRFDSFSGNSYLQENEGYKARILSKAQGALGSSGWDETTLARRGRISERALRAMDLSFNLVHYQQRLHFANVLSESPGEAERAIYDVYRSQDIEAAFQGVTDVFGAKYDLVSYLFFLRDGSRFLPVRPRMFEGKLRIVGVDLKMEGRCSWANYQEYLGTIAAIRAHLEGYFGFDAPPTLLDAHSFVWMADDIEEYGARRPSAAPEAPTGRLSKDREATVKQRVGQDLFRRGVVEYWGGRCAITGCADKRVLVASHIKPWRVCDKDNEWLDPFNGILLSPNLDSLFDSGLISFGDDGRIILSDQLGEDDASRLGVNPDMRLARVDSRHLPFLRYHRANVLLR